MPSSGPEVALRRPAGLGLAAAGLAGVGMALAAVSGQQILGARWGLLVRLAAWAMVWAAGVACAIRLPRRVALPAVFAIALALRLAALAGPPLTSDDLYRYSWDARVQLSGRDPYRFTPSSAYLVTLRERWLWPDEKACAALYRKEGCTRINRPFVHTIYPPVAEAWFTAVYRLGGGIGARYKVWQVAGLVGDMALVGILPFVLRAWRRDERWTALYALSPVPVLEVVNNGHVDGLAALLIVAALLLAARRRPGWAGALLGAAALVKLYPALLVLALLGVGVAGRRLAGFLRAAGAATAVFVLGYLPHVAVVGSKVIGYLPGYLREEHYDGGSRYLLAGILGLPAGLTAALAGAGVLGVAAWVIRRRPEPPAAMAALLGGLLLAVTPVQPWYALTLLAIATVAVAPRWAVLAAAGYPYFFAVILDSPHAVGIGRVSYGLALLAVVAATRFPVAVDG